MPGAVAAITLVAVAALLSALDPNVYGASRMAYSLAERSGAGRSATPARFRVQGPGSGCCGPGQRLFGVVTVVLEWLSPRWSFRSCSTL
ncbi:hypothetical protein [Arthrobacter sp. R1-13]